MRWRLLYTPVYALLSEHGGHSIELAPQSAPAQATFFLDGANPELEEDMMDISAPEARIASDTRVLLSVSISDDATCDIAEWKEWLTHKAPRIVTQIGVKVEAVFKSHSTMLMTSLPIVVWDCLPDKAAYRFMGFVKSGNLDQTCSHGGNQHERVALSAVGDQENERLATTVNDQQRELRAIKRQMQLFESRAMSTLNELAKDRERARVDRPDMQRFIEDTNKKYVTQQEIVTQNQDFLQQKQHESIEEMEAILSRLRETRSIVDKIAGNAQAQEKAFQDQASSKLGLRASRQHSEAAARLYISQAYDTSESDVSSKPDSGPPTPTLL
ncbi:MAG: hypothetical protein Q9204_008318 [Flavoplaca sp. TL-2023a]